VKPSKTVTISVISLAILGALLLATSRSDAVVAVYPVDRAHQMFCRRILTRIGGFFRGAAASAENVRLRREVASLSLLAGDLEKLEAENARLRRALDYAARVNGRWVAAGVLSRDGAAAGVRRTLRVDRGSLAGVREGAVVVVPEGLVGRVSAVTLHTSEVTLVTDSSVKVACEIVTDRPLKPRGILWGGNEDTLVLRHLTNAEEVPARSRVLTSGQGGVFPRGIEVGTLLDVHKDEKGLACEGEVLPLVEFSALEDVFIRCEQ